MTELCDSVIGRPATVCQRRSGGRGSAGTISAVSASSAPAPPVVLFDGVCNLCNGAVGWILERDRRGVFRFASLRSAAARRLLDAASAPAALPDSIVLVDESGVHTRSAAVLRIARRLGFPWSLAVLASLIPRPGRDALYDAVARRRYRWFGRREACLVPTPERRARFLDADERNGGGARG